MVGNTPNFTKIDVLRCFLRFKKNLGRQELARELELGEGTIRTILEKLKEKNLLESTKKGHFLSKRGTEILSQTFIGVSLPKEVEIKEIYPGYKKIAILLKNASNFKEVYKLRDIAVKNGAEGAVILHYKNKLYAPESDYNFDYSELEKYFRLENGDVLIISFSNNKRYAENGAFAIAIELSQELKKFMSSF